MLPTLQLRGNAKERRRDFRHVVSSFLDLVSMNLAGGRGVPEALQSAVSLSNGWGMVRIRETLQTARLQGVTPWAALGDLGEEMAVEELRDLAAALALVAEDGAKVRESLAARAVSMRQRELADAEGRAAAALPVHADRPAAALRGLPVVPDLPAHLPDSRVLIRCAR